MSCGDKPADGIPGSDDIDGSEDGGRAAPDDWGRRWQMRQRHAGMRHKIRRRRQDGPVDDDDNEVAEMIRSALLSSYSSVP